MSRWEPDAASRLMKAATELFDEQGYDATTVAEIAERAGLTKRTFFRHYADKREVLFNGSGQLERCWLEGIEAAPADAEPLAAVAAGFDPVAEMFAERHAFARVRSRIVQANPELQERELIKLHKLAGVVKGALLRRGVPEHAATLAAHVGLAVFSVAFGHWVEQNDPARLRALFDESLAQMRSVTSA
ncbi:TetR family transcriptional regulator [Actinospica durhamensis]|uniref:TetR family transcriptional regulator n=1 Tax=Actinospica durhamensis TaxID=1508375 RepID=A0A941EP35_9ACTN|nr:TetR/AcrR family transcriptional regulator [Actinospica durhamensis]MBR7832584.1 TetR family transcriptional regulator [Actinospica durhamensis]